MKKVNFNNLDSIQIPEAWTKNALSLPKTLENKKKVASFSKFSRNLALVASLVLVCALSVSLFIFTQKGDILNTQKPTQSSDSTVFAQTEQTNQSERETSSVTQEETQETETSSSTEPTEKTVDDTKKPTTPSTTKPTTSGDNEAISPDGSPTSNPSGSLSGGQTPTQKPSPTEPPVIPEAPEFVFDGKITVQFPGSYLTGNGGVYCQIYDAYGTPLGDSDPYSDTHRAFLSYTPTDTGSSIAYEKATYYIDRVGFSLSEGTYRYCFYNENGEPICNGLFDVYY